MRCNLTEDDAALRGCAIVKNLHDYLAKAAAHFYTITIVKNRTKLTLNISSNHAFTLEVLTLTTFVITRPDTCM